MGDFFKSIYSEDLAAPKGRMEDDITDEEWQSAGLKSIFDVDGDTAHVRKELFAIIESVADFRTCPQSTLAMFYAAGRSVFEGNEVALGALTALENLDTPYIVRVFFFKEGVTRRDEFRRPGGIIDKLTIQGKAPRCVPGPDSDVIISYKIFQFNGGFLATFKSNEEEAQFRAQHKIPTSTSFDFNVPLLVLAKVFQLIGRNRECDIALQMASTCQVANLSTAGMAQGFCLANRLKPLWKQFQWDDKDICEVVVSELVLRTVNASTRTVNASTTAAVRSVVEPVGITPAHPKGTTKHPDARTEPELLIVDGRTLIRAQSLIGLTLQCHAKKNRDNEGTVIWFLITSREKEGPGYDKTVCFASWNTYTEQHEIKPYEGTLNGLLLNVRGFPDLASSSDQRIRIPVGQTKGEYHIGSDSAYIYKKRLFAKLRVTLLTDDGSTFHRTSMFPQIPLRVSGSHSSSSSSRSSSASNMAEDEVFYDGSPDY